MKKIVLIRHAKSSWEYSVTDHQRPLSSRGFNDAELISKVLKNANFNIDLLISSDALRAKTTADIFVKELDINTKKVCLNSDLYDFSGSNLVRIIKTCTDSVKTLMIFGHNNAITNFVNNYGDSYIDNVPTCGVTVLNFNINAWNDLKKGVTIKTLFPRDLK